MSNFKKKIFSLMVLFLVLGLLHNLQAMPINPRNFDPATGLLKNGQPLPAYKGVPANFNPERTKGVNYCLVVLIQCPDESGRFQPAEFEDLLFTTGTYPTGSMNDYYLETSYNQLGIDGAVSGWHTAEHEYNYYTNGNMGFGAYPNNAGRLVEEAVDLAELAGVDFSLFDNDGDGTVDSLMVVHQGPGYEYTLNPNDIWSHSSAISYMGGTAREYDGVTINPYTIMPEVAQSGGPDDSIATIGVFCHEYGHALGLPDIYDYDSPDLNSVVSWCLMAYGAWAGPTGLGEIPTHFCSAMKIMLGWMSSALVDPGSLEIPQLETNPYCVRIPINESSLEYFLLENRNAHAEGTLFDHYAGWGSELDSGLIIMHVDENMSNNNGPPNADHYRYWVEDVPNQSNRNLLDAAYAAEDAQIEFTPETDPNSDGYISPSGIWITQISNSGELMTAQFELSQNVQCVDHNLSGNELVLTLYNYGKLATSVEASLSTTDPFISVQTDPINFGNIDYKESKDNSGNPFQVEIVNGAPQGHVAEIEIHVTSNEGAFSADNVFYVILNSRRVLFVDDDNGEDWELYFKTSLGNNFFAYDYWNATDWTIQPGNLANYTIVVWNTGANSYGLISETEEKALRNYLDRGGNLFFASQEYLFDFYGYPNEDDYFVTSPGDFARDYLHIVDGEQDEFYYSVTGVEGDPITGNYGQLALTNLFGVDLYWPDDFETDTEAAPIFISGPNEGQDEVEVILQGPGGLRYPATGKADYRLIFIAFPFESLPSFGSLVNQKVIMNDFLLWLEPNLDLKAPAEVDDLEAMFTESLNTITLTWTAPGDDGNSGIAYSYEFRCSPAQSIDENNWYQAISLSGAPLPAEPGTMQQWVINTSDLPADDNIQGYYFAMRTVDVSGNISNISNSSFALPVIISSFVAIPGTDQITLQWVTESEINNLGFNVYRSDNLRAGFTKINLTLIPGAGNSSTPHSYSFIDRNVHYYRTYYYYLEDVSYNGSTGKSETISAKLQP